jgi:serine phosphatase RsbU (regulator of sigma subunit)
MTTRRIAILVLANDQGCQPASASLRRARLDPAGRDRFLLYTDGLIEAANRGDDLFGIDGVERTLAAASGSAADAVADAILAAKEQWSGLPPAVDMTLIVIEVSALRQAVARP